MKNGLNAHPQVFSNVSRDIAMLLRLAPTFVRVSALQFGVINQERANRVKRMVDAGLKVVGLCTSETCATMSDREWSNYCITYDRLSAWCGVTYDQIGNEWNGPFWNGAQDLRKVCARFNMAQCIIGHRCIAPGVTCENKTSSAKTKATSFIRALLAETDPLAFDLHWYVTDVKQKAVFEECVKLLKGKCVVVLETGCSDAAKQEAWYKSIKGGVWGAEAQHTLLYSYNDSLLVGFSLVDRNSNPGPLARKILAGEI